MSTIETETASLVAEEALDPADWDAFRQLAHTMVDRLIDFQRHVHGTPAWRPVPAAVDARFAEAAPAEGSGPQGAWRDFLELVLPYPAGLHHARWWGWAGGWRAAAACSFRAASRRSSRG
jgi:hypothetical protein